ncbi:MAG: helix-turn-helix domain-containing protein [Candidatus Methanomethyliaceae archaeon]
MRHLSFQKTFISGEVIKVPRNPELQAIKTIPLAEAPDFFGPQVLAKVLGIGECTAYDMCHIQGFPVLKAGRKYIVSKAGLIRWLEKHVG